MARLKRSNNNQNLALTGRDENILKYLYRFTVLTNNQIFDLVGGGKDGLKKRLTKLFDSGYVARPSIQAEMNRYQERRPLIYALGQKGAEYLQIELGYSLPPTVDWDRKAKDRKGIRGQFKLRHDIGANGATISLRNALQKLDGIEVFDPEEIIAQSPAGTQKAHKPFSIPTKFKWSDGKIYERLAEPDGVVGYIDHRFEKPIRAILFIEFDQEMDVKRSDPRQSSILQKIASYTDILKRKTTLQRYGFAHFRVLFVTTGSEKHEETMIDVCREFRASKIPAYPYFFTTIRRFENAENPLGEIWRNGDGKPDTITTLAS